MTVPNDTQTIDADALRARLAEMAQRARDEMAPAGLRERIEAALRARHGDGVTVEFFARGNAVARVRYSVPGLHCVTSVFCHNENDGGALGALAYACGLNVDGTDPRDQGEALARRLHAERESVVAELDRARDETDALRALLEVAQTSLAAATSGRRVTACDEIERLQRENATLRDAAREMLAAIEAPAPVWDADESEHDAHAARLTAAIAALRPLVGDGALDATRAAEDHATADDPLLDGTDGAHPAWWRGHDRAAEMLTAQRDAAVAAERARCTARVRDVGDRWSGLKSTATTRAARAVINAALRGIETGDTGADIDLVAQRDVAARERDALRDAAREYLDARHRGLVALDAYLDADPADAAARDAASACEARVTATRTRLAALVGDDATMRRDLTADLIDGAYVLRPHSRRETARVGLGGIVWCDGGTVRAR